MVCGGSPAWEGGTSGRQTQVHRPHGACAYIVRIILGTDSSLSEKGYATAWKAHTVEPQTRADASKQPPGQTSSLPQRNPTKNQFLHRRRPYTPNLRRLRPDSAPPSVSHAEWHPPRRPKASSAAGVVPARTHPRRRPKSPAGDPAEGRRGAAASRSPRPHLPPPHQPQPAQAGPLADLARTPQIRRRPSSRRRAVEAAAGLASRKRVRRPQLRLRPPSLLRRRARQTRRGKVLRRTRRMPPTVARTPPSNPTTRRWTMRNKMPVSKLCSYWCVRVIHASHSTPYPHLSIRNCDS